MPCVARSREILTLLEQNSSSTTYEFIMHAYVRFVEGPDLQHNARENKGVRPGGQGCKNVIDRVPVLLDSGRELQEQNRCTKEP